MEGKKNREGTIKIKEIKLCEFVLFMFEIYKSMIEIKKYKKKMIEEND